MSDLLFTLAFVPAVIAAWVVAIFAIAVLVWAIREVFRD